MRDHRQVVRDQQVGDAQTVAQLGQQVQHRGLDRHVERRGRFVEHDDPRLGRERAGDADALLLAARELVGIARAVGCRQAHTLEQRVDPAIGLRAARQTVQHQRPAQHLAHGVARVERAVGILEHHLAQAAQPFQPGAARVAEILARERDGAAVSLLEAQHQASEGRLAAARLADQPQHLAGAHGEGHAVDRRHAGAAPQPAAERERFLEIARLDQRCCVVDRRRRRGGGRGGQRAQSIGLPAAGAAIGIERDQRLRLLAAGLGIWAAIRKDAAGRWLREVGQAAGDRCQGRAADGTLWQRADQAARIGMTWRAEQRRRRALLDNAAGIQHRDRVAHALDHAEIVADEQQRQVPARAQVGEQVEDLRLDRDVERGRRLVEHQKARLTAQRRRDQGALLHAARQLVRIGGGDRAGIGNTDFIEEGNRAVARGLSRKAAMAHQRLGNLAADGERGIERLGWVLEHQRDAVAAQGAPAVGQIGALEAQGARRHGGLAAQQIEQRQRDRALARARLADQPERAAHRHRERDVVERVHGAVRRRVLDAQSLDLEQRGHESSRCGSRGSRTWRSPSPNRLTPMSSTHSAMPGPSAIQGAVSRNGRASAIIRPQSLPGGCEPRPKKLSAEPSRIAKVMRSAHSTMIGGQALGSSSWVRM